MEQTTRMMEEVVLEGTGKKAAVPGYRAAGKTGTAQKLDRHTGTYAAGHYVALFIGFLPVERPEVAIAVVVNEPRKGAQYYGGDVAAPVFSAVARQCMLALGVPPSSGERVLTVQRKHEKNPDGVPWEQAGANAGAGAVAQTAAASVPQGKETL